MNLNIAVGFLSTSLLSSAGTMDYNQLKVRILSLMDPAKDLDSVQIGEKLASDGLRGHGEKALEMALLRYWRQGLLSRTRRGRRFYYQLTERGKARREWLLKSLKRA
jgi:DNA-binding PadR family transcriptional regulator